MSRTVEAIYEDGVFKPLQKIAIKEHEKVEITVFSKEEWQSRFKNLITRVREKSASYSAAEIESDIVEGIKEKLDP